ncbi:uncharacterized protein LOC124936478 [Impatiens glandulifera]|uniref:uncharacterized protein LOC124936478 n=1 Tax=Impatiens glandulifera TaxID=253017 RepID=UPI001FB12B42|nr:uncharacterized protein LOC124936478 [Impatiens glandulifera]
MCPLRFILIFLSAVLAGFFVLKNINSQSDISDDQSDDTSLNLPADSPPNRSSKVWGAMSTGFWTFVDMASGRYLWRNLTSSSSRSD